MSGSILDKIRSADNLPTLPTVAVEVLRLVHSDDGSIAQIAGAIEKDPVLTSRILKVANSSFFGMSRQVSSLQQAMVVLGLRTVKVMALTFSLIEATQGRAMEGFDYRTYWRQSLTAAVAARLLSEKVGWSRTDEAFVTALLADIGTLAAFHADREAYLAILTERASTGLPLHVIEEKRFGMTHEAFSSVLVDAWGLPERMVKAIELHHHDPQEMIHAVAETNQLVRTVGAAMIVSEVFCSPGGAGQLPNASVQIPSLVPVSRDGLREILDGLQKEVQGIASTWAIDIGTARSYKEIQAEGIVELARLSMAAELERAQLVARERELHDQNRDLARKAATDCLTGLANRFALEQHLDLAWSTAAEQDEMVGMLLLDLDRFKRLNDTFGHLIGDAALRKVGDHLRSLDDQRHLAARYGGEEFAVVVTGTSPDELSRLGEQIRLRIQQIRVPLRDRQVGITVSIGAAVMNPKHSRAAADLIARADQCLYQAKQTGRNRLICAGPDHGRPTPPAPRKHPIHAVPAGLH